MSRRPIDDILTPLTCRHGGRAGRQPSGDHWCPICRAEEARAAAEAATRDQEHRRHEARLQRLGFRNGRPPLDVKMRAAGERPDIDD